jgi:hypothetical protein
MVAWVFEAAEDLRDARGAQSLSQADLAGEDICFRLLSWFGASNRQYWPFVLTGKSGTPLCPTADLDDQDRLASFMLMVRQYRHIKALQRGGRGHEAGGIVSTERGALAVKCLACPDPDTNLAIGWECHAGFTLLFILLFFRSFN